MTTNTTTDLPGRSVSPVIEAFVETWSRALQDADRARLIPNLASTARGPKTDDDLRWIATDWLVRVHTPMSLRFAGLAQQAEQLETLPQLTKESAPELADKIKVTPGDSTNPIGGRWADDEIADAWTAIGAAAEAAVGDEPGDRIAWYAIGAAWDAAWTAWCTCERTPAEDVTVAVLQDSAADLIARMCDHAKAA